MRKYNLIILAGGEDDSWCQQYGYRRKAFLPVLGRPMIEWVINAFKQSKHIDNIILVGPKELDQVASVNSIRKRLAGGNSFIANILTGVLYLKSFIYKFKNHHNGYLISFCDAAFLTTDIIDKTLENMSASDADIILHYVERQTLAEAGYPDKDRSYMQVAGKSYTGSNLYYVSNFRKLLGVLGDIKLLRKYRKEPHKILEHIGCRDKNPGEIRDALCHILKAKVDIIISPFAQMGVDVDKSSDYELAQDVFLRLGQSFSEEKPTLKNIPK